MEDVNASRSPNLSDTNTNIIVCYDKKEMITSLPKVIWEDGRVAAKVSQGAV